MPHPCLYNCSILLSGKEPRLTSFLKGGRGKVGWDGSAKGPERTSPTESNDWDSTGLTEIRKPRLVRPRSLAYVLWVCSLVFLTKCLWLLSASEAFTSYWIASWKLDVRIYIWLNCSLLTLIWLMFLGGGDRVLCSEGTWKGCESGRKEWEGKDGSGKKGKLHWKWNKWEENN